MATTLQRSWWRMGARVEKEKEAAQSPFPEERGQERGEILQRRYTKNDEEAEKSTDTSEADLNVKDDEKQPVFVPAACTGEGKGVWGMHRTFKCKKCTCYRHTRRIHAGQRGRVRKIARVFIRIVHMQKAHIAYWTAAAGHH